MEHAERMKQALAAGIAAAALLAAGCGGSGSDPDRADAAAASAPSTARPAAQPPAAVVVEPTEGLPDEFPPELVPPGAASSEWEPTGAGTDVWFESTAGFQEAIEFYTAALEPPLDVSLDEGEGVNKAIWVYKPGVEHITVIITETDPLLIKVSGLF